MATRYSRLDTKELPRQRIIHRYTIKDSWPQLPEGRIAVTAGGHKIWNQELTETVDNFCASNDAVVFTDHSSGYHGRYSVHATLPASQEMYDSKLFDVGLLIHIGEESGDYMVFGKLPNAKEVWRVSEDGELRDTFRKLTKVFQVPEDVFFAAYTDEEAQAHDDFYKECMTEINAVKESIPDLPFSNIWLAQHIAHKIPEGSFVHLGVSNTMRSWTFFDFPDSVTSIANVGCRGIDGALSTALGMSLVNTDRLHFCVLGDLTFFYNIGALGNRNLGRNMRILLVNNGMGAEFRLYSHPGQSLMGDECAPYTAGAGHSGNKSHDLVRHYAQDLGFEYLTASNAEDAEKAIERFITPKLTDKPMLFEAFTDYRDESNALKLIRNCRKEFSAAAKVTAKRAVKRILGPDVAKVIKNLVKK